MAGMRTPGVLILLAWAPLALAAVPECVCDPADSESMAAWQCSLTREALAHPAPPPVFFLRDINPTKVNRWLALPAAVRNGVYTLAEMTPEERLQLWTDAIRRARELWKDEWGLAVNGDQFRTQCQPHIHIGRLMEGVETRKFVVVGGPAQIPVPPVDEGLWVHPVGDKLHVHTGEQLTETVLFR
jgi:hypothetical protein